ncbi:MAG: DNA repair protein RecO [Bacteroidales bacterium]|nr:DNA repair protein RecO [Bacteroidales bacterium]
MLTKIRGIVLHTIKYKESSVITHIYTDLYGRQSFLIHSVHGRRSKFSPNIFQPFSRIEAEAYYKPERELQKVKEVNSQPYKTIPYDIVKSTQAMFLAEVIYKSVREEEANPDLFEYLVHSMEWLDTAEEKYTDFHLIMLIQLTRYLGFFPEKNYSEQRCYFDLRNGEFIKDPSVHPDMVNKEISRNLNEFLYHTSGSLKDIHLDYSARINLTDSLIDYYNLHIPSFGKVQSVAVLRELFG